MSERELKNIYPLPEIIINEVCEYNNITLTEFNSKLTTRIISQSRHQVIFLLRNITKTIDQETLKYRRYYFKEIAEMFNHHVVSVRKGYQTIKGIIETDKRIKNETDNIKKNCFKNSTYTSYEAYLLDKINQYQTEYEIVSGW